MLAFRDIQKIKSRRYEKNICSRPLVCSCFYGPCSGTKPAEWKIFCGRTEDYLDPAFGMETFSGVE
jgi:hypothetical protein